jgi:putative DNA primase/helicase
MAARGAAPSETQREAIPRELRELPRWVGWRRETRDGKPTKVLKRHDTGRNAKANNPATWGTYAQAVAGAARHNFDGVGFVFADGDDIMGADLDHCRDPETGELHPDAQAIADEFATYQEASPSGTGLHILLRGHRPAGAKNKRTLGEGFGGTLDVELYETGRYFTVTGDALGDVLEVRDCQPALDALCARLWPPKKPADATTPEPAPTPLRERLGLSDADLVEKACRAPGQFAALWAGDTAAHDGDDSRADAALLSSLAWWTNGDADRMDRLFRASGLYRPKWDEEHYHAPTMAAALEWYASDGRGGYTGIVPNNGNGSNGNGSKPAGVPAQAPTMAASAQGAQGAAAGPPLPGLSDTAQTTDTANAARFCRDHGHRVRYCAPEGQWYVYDGVAWVADTVGRVEDLMRASVVSIFREAAEATEGDTAQGKRLGKWAADSLSAARRRAALECARSLPAVVVTPDVFDRDLYAFNCLNGTLDLRTGELRPHNPADLITKLAPVEYDPAARSELWERVLREATEGDADFVDYLQRAAGYCLTGDCREEVFFVFAGREASMKSTYVEALAATMGDYAQAADPQTFLARSQVGGPMDGVAGMEGARLVHCGEFDRGRRMAEALVKQLAGGDTVRARHLYQREREFRFTAKLVFHTNDVPRMSDDDGAVWRRVRIAPFEHSIPEDRRDPAVKAALCNPAVSGAAILAWAVAGCLVWQRGGLGKAPAVAQATQNLRLSMDPLSDFFNECCQFVPDVWTATADLRRVYEQWAGGSTEKSLSPKAFGARLAARGLENRTYGKGNRRGWVGIACEGAEYALIDPDN